MASEESVTAELHQFQEKAQNLVKLIEQPYN